MDLPIEIIAIVALVAIAFIVLAVEEIRKKKESQAHDKRAYTEELPEASIAAEAGSDAQKGKVRLMSWIIKKAKTAAVTFIIVFVGFFVQLVIKALVKTDRHHSIDRFLATGAKKMNKTLPTMADSITRLDSVAVRPERIFQYNYTVLCLKDELFEDSEDSIDFVKEVYTDNLNTVKRVLKTSRQELSLYRNNNVVLEFFYRDQNGEEIARLRFEKKDYTSD